MPPAPKVSSGAKTIPSFLKSAAQRKDSFLPADDLKLANLDTTTLRTGATTAKALRDLVKASPDLSSAVYSACRIISGSRYVVIGRNLDGTVNYEATRIAQQLCRRFDLLGPSDGGYNAFPSIKTLTESLAKELMTLGACSFEVVLNSMRLPEGLRGIATDTIKWKYNGKRKVPYQVVGSEEISLDLSSFFYMSLDQSLNTAYSESPVESAIQPILASQTFLNDLRKVFRRAISPRLLATINTEEFKKSLTPDILHDPEKLKEYMDTTIDGLRSLVDGLEPEDALVVYDLVKLELMSAGNNSLSNEYDVYQGILDSKMASGSKTMPTVLGHKDTSNVASTQTMLYLKSLQSIMLKLDELFSRAMTFGVRLYGVDAVVEFKFDEPNLRPESELEAFYAMRQSRILEQLSLGLITDEEASLITTRTLPLPGAEPLSGTMFKVEPAKNVSTPESNTSALNQDLSGDAPKEKKT